MKDTAAERRKLAKRLKDLRTSQEWSKTEVAEKLGLNNMATYANWEYGTRSPNPTIIAEIASLYAVSTDYILGKTESLTNEQVALDRLLREECSLTYEEKLLSEQDKLAIDQFLKGYFWGKH